MSYVYAGLSFVEVAVLFASFGTLVFFIARAIKRAAFGPKVERPKPEDLRHLKRAGQ